jgi:putative transposase
VIGQVAQRVVLHALGLSTATYYRRRNKTEGVAKAPRKPSMRALSAGERVEVLDILHSKRFIDRAPDEVVATLLEENKYLCSARTMYRVLASQAEVRERRNQLRHPTYHKPELIARGPNEVWSWDITKLKTHMKLVYLYLYVVLDIFSRFVVGWLLAQRENGALGSRLIHQACETQQIEPGQLTIHADRGGPMRSNSMVQLTATLDLQRSYSRPHVSNDNPFSESLFRTVKYCPSFPDRFGGMADGLVFCRELFPWYNYEHHHSGLCYLTPAQVHEGKAEEVLIRRQATKKAAYTAHPERFPRGEPRLQQLPDAVWINRPRPLDEERASQSFLAGLLAEGSMALDESRVAEGDERSELALYAASGMEQPQASASTSLIT